MVVMLVRVSDFAPSKVGDASHPAEIVRRPLVTEGVTRGAVRLLIELGHAPLAEVPLPNGRRADLMALSPRGEIVIVEVKSGVDDFRTDAKWPQYLEFCDRFYFAVAPEFPRRVLPSSVGMIVADGFGGAVLIEAPMTPLAGARRRALTLQFARLAAWRASADRALAATGAPAWPESAAACADAC